MVGCAQGALSRLYVEPGSSPYTFDANSETYEFVAESLRRHGSIVMSNGIRGTRSAYANRSRLGPSYVAGSILFNPDPAMLDLWLPRILGASESTDVFALAESLPSFAVLIDRVTTTFEYKDCYVNRAILRGRRTPAGDQPDPLELIIEIVGKTRARGTSAPAVSLSTATNAAPYIFHDGALTMVSATREFFDFQLEINNHIHIRTANSLTPTALCPQHRTVTFSCNVPFTSDELTLLDQDALGTAANLTFTNGNMSLQIAMATLQVPYTDPVVPGKREITLPVTGYVTQLTTTKELVLTSDSTA